MKNYKSFIVLCCLIPSLNGCGVIRGYNREQMKMDFKAKGEADLLEAESGKKVAIETAKAKLDSAKMNAEADIIRAEGIAKSNKIIGDSLSNNKAYLEWLWIDNIEKNPNQVFYIPTENKVPIFNLSTMSNSKKENPQR